MSKSDQAHGGRIFFSIVKVHTFILILWYIERKVGDHCCRLSLIKVKVGLITVEINAAHFFALSF